MTSSNDDVVCKLVISDVAVFVLKRDVKLQPTNRMQACCLLYQCASDLQCLCQHCHLVACEKIFYLKCFTEIDHYNHNDNNVTQT